MIDIFNEMENMRKKMDRMMQEFMRRPFISTSIREPLMNIKDEGNALRLKFEIPGVKKEDISVHLTENTIEIIAGRKKIKEKKTGRSYFAEYGEQFFQTYRILPEKVIPESAKAKYKDGILEIIVKKLNKTAKKKHKVKVA